MNLVSKLIPETLILIFNNRNSVSHAEKQNKKSTPMVHPGKVEMLGLG